jgi:hypothetical protein
LEGLIFGESSATYAVSDDRSSSFLAHHFGDDWHPAANTAAARAGTRRTLRIDMTAGSDQGAAPTLQNTGRRILGATG